DGNNSAFWQDQGGPWFGWSSPGTPLIDFTRRLIRLRLEQPVFRRKTFFRGCPVLGSSSKDLAWFQSDGREMTEALWLGGTSRSVGMRLAGDAIGEADDTGAPIVGDTFLVLLNAEERSTSFVLPGPERRPRRIPLLDTPAWDVP